MKTLLVTVSLAVAGVSAADAQVFRPSVGSGAVVGAVAGGLIGGHNGDRWAEGAVIGAAAGALIGAALTPAQSAYVPPPVYQTYQTAAPSYGQQVYTNSSPQVVYAPASTIPDAPTVANAPTVVTTPAPQVVQAPPQVVYVQQQPQVVYVPAPAREVVYVRPPVVSFGLGFYSGPRYYPSYRSGYHGHSHHSHYRSYPVHRGHSHGRGRW